MRSQGPLLSGTLVHWWADSPSAFLQDDVGGRGLATHGLHLTTGGQHDGGGPGDPTGDCAAGHRVRLWPKED